MANADILGNVVVEGLAAVRTVASATVKSRHRSKHIKEDRHYRVRDLARWNQECDLSAYYALQLLAYFFQN